ncbi:MAG: hypothetical protein ACT4N8_00375 [Sphingosinicella sp.]|uniref:hypothetical protein n=1 Tax=Sphingosinicella sp. TaxID=1917971 RepID=UPI004037F1D9
MTEKAQAAALDWLDRPGVVKRLIFLGGGLMALILLGVCVFVDVLGWFSRNPVGVLAVAAALVSALALSGIRYLFDRMRSRSGLSPAGYGRITYGRGVFMLVQLGATGWLAAIALTTWVLDLGWRVPAFHALIFVMVGSMFIAMTLSAIAHIVEMVGSALGFRPLVSPPGRGGP